jgi:hypothetical protein
MSNPRLASLYYVAAPTFANYVYSVKQSHYRPGQAHRAPEVEAPRFQDNRHMKVIRLSVLRNVRLNTQELFLVLISVRG